MDNFLFDLCKAPWHLLNGTIDVNAAFNTWISIFNDVCDLHCPLIERRVKRFKQPDWFSNDILDVMKKRDMTLKQARLFNSHDLWNEYKVLRNKVVHLIVHAKKNLLVIRIPL